MGPSDVEGWPEPEPEMGLRWQLAPGALHNRWDLSRAVVSVLHGSGRILTVRRWLCILGPNSPLSSQVQVGEGTISLMTPILEAHDCYRSTGCSSASLSSRPAIDKAILLGVR